MASLLSYIPLVKRFVANSSDSVQSIDIPSVEIHDVETARDKRPRTLKHLLRANHTNHAVMYHQLMYHNHLPHILCSAYLLGADAPHLHRIYEVESKELEPWTDSPEEIDPEDWRLYLGDPKYQRAYMDLFEDALALRFKYDWKKTVEDFMFNGHEPLINGLIGGLGHPLIHLGYAYEMNSKEIAMEALTMTAVCYDFLHKYTDDPSYTKPSTFSSTSPREILDKLASEKRLDGVFQNPGYENIEPLFEKHEDIILEYWNAWTISDPLKQFRESQEAAVAMVVATVAPGTHSYNFFMVHVLTTSHAVRILLPLIPAKFHVKLVRQWWLMTLAVYMAEMRPKIDEDYIGHDLKGRVWKDVEEKALNSEWATDAHYVKAIRAMKEAAMTWGDVHERCLKAAARFADDFEGWVH